ncbi:MAG: TolC family protein [Chthoniobacteraceae bacterium]
MIIRCLVTTALFALAPLAFAADQPADEGRHLPRVEPIAPISDEDSARASAQGELSHLSGSSRTFGKKTPGTIPGDFAPWWIRGQRNTLGEGDRSEGVNLENLFVRAINYSTQIKVFSDLPLIRETGITEAAGAFDTTAFLEGRFDRRNEPVGNTLTTGGSSRFKQDEWAVETGIRKKINTGAEVRVSQEFSRIDNNSIYFTPNPQSRATLSLQVIQPLLRGAGMAYNRSIMQIARLDSEVAMHEFVRQSESHLLEIARTYWALYAARVTYLQKAKLIDETARITDELKARQKVDAQKSQLFRAESALADRRAALIRSEAAVRNAQDRLKALTSDPRLTGDAHVEIVPGDRLVLTNNGADAQSAARVAMENRPEIQQAFLQLRAASIREKMSKNELMPELNLVLNGTLGGLDNDYGGAYGREWNTGGPGYGAGLVLSFPLENHAAKARYERRRIEMRQQINQLKTTIDTVMLEVKISAREVGTAWREMQAKYAAVEAYTADVSTIEARRSMLTLDDSMQMGAYLDTVLDSQDRRTLAEEDFIRAAANYQVALVNMQRAKGRLLAYESVNVVRDVDERGVPLLYLEKGARGGKEAKAPVPAK